MTFHDDTRSDVWAFGCVLFEMLTGRRAFEGEDVSDTLAAVLRSDPAWEALPASVPHSIRTLLKGCLEKQHRERIRDISTALFVLKHADPLQGTAPARPSLPARRRALAAAVAAGALLGAGAVAMWPRPSAAEPPQVARFGLPLPEGQVLTLSRRAVAVSPDGSHIAYTADGRIYVRPVAEGHARPVAGADAGILPAFSPDGQSILFWASTFRY